MIKPTKAKGRQEKPRLKVMHIVSKDSNGNATIASRTVPKLKAAVGPDVQQAAEEHARKVPKAKTVEKPKDKDQLSDDQLHVLKAMVAMGGKDLNSMPIAQHLKWDKGSKTPRGRVRASMKHLAELGLATSKRQGVKYVFSVTEKGKSFKNNPTETEKDKSPASNPVPSERPANTDIQCSKCQTWNPYIAVHCKNCGEKLQPVQAITAVTK